MHKARYLVKVEIRLVWHDLLLMNVRWLLYIFFSFLFFSFLFFSFLFFSFLFFLFFSFLFFSFLFFSFLFFSFLFFSFLFFSFFWCVCIINNCLNIGVHRRSLRKKIPRNNLACAMNAPFGVRQRGNSKEWVIEMVRCVSAILRN